MPTLTTPKTRAALVDAEPMLKAADMERIFNMHRRTIARLCRQGLLPMPVKIGGGYRWKAAEVGEALERFEGKRT